MPTFFVYPQTGFQIKSNIDIDDSLRKLFPISEDFWGYLWEYAARNQNEITEALRDHTAVSADDEALWLCVPGKKGMYYRIRKGTDERYTLDMGINTNLYDIDGRREVGSCDVPMPNQDLKKDIKDLDRREIANFTVLPPGEDSCTIGDLIIDFGNTGTVSAFLPAGNNSSLHIIPIFNPWDPKDGKGEVNGRSLIDKWIFHSNQLLFRFDSGCEPANFLVNQLEDFSDDDYQFANKLWWLSGERANEIAKNISYETTYIFSPKKFVREWDDNESYANPKMFLCGIQRRDENGRVQGVFDKGIEPAPIIKEVLRSQIGLIISSYVRPEAREGNSIVVPKFNRVLLSYPLTWRKKDKDFFKRMVEEIFSESFYQLKVDNDFNVEMLYYNEPFCVVAYLVSVIIEKFGGSDGNWELIRSIMGNFDKNTSETRLLIVDIGGGSTDIALVDVSLDEKSQKRDCRLNLKSTMRFNRAGDRISHIISTIIWEHIKKSRDLNFNLCLGDNDIDDSYRRIVRKLQLDIMQLSETVKKTLALGIDWYWTFPNENEILTNPNRNEDPLFPIISRKNVIIRNIQTLLDSVSPLSTEGGEQRKDEAFLSSFMISNEIIERCIELDRGGRDRVGFYDILNSLKNLLYSLKKESDSMPDRIILSGRTSRLPCIKSLLNKVFRGYVPSYRIVSLEDFLPAELRGDHYEFIEKLAVMLGIHEFRRGKLSAMNVDSGKFHQFVGPVVEFEDEGCILSKTNGSNWKLCSGSDYIKPGAMIKGSYLELLVRPGTTVELGQSYSERGYAEVLGKLSVKEMTDEERRKKTEDGEFYRVKIKFDEDNSVDINDEFVTYSENIPGGIEPADNFCYDGKLDLDGSIRRNIVFKVYDRLRKA